jgi:uncharacterized protein YjbI with pentapeptide repeats
MTDQTKPPSNKAPTPSVGDDAFPQPAADGTRQVPSTATAFAATATDLQALRAAVADAASATASLWFSYIFTFFYLAIAVGGVTHRDLLLENPVKLPFLNVDLPLVGFFTLAPGIFLIVHTHVLIYFVLLANKVSAFDAQLRSQITDREERARLRRQLPSNIFVQLIAGPREIRTGIMGLMLNLIAQTSLAIGPVGLLILFQLQFLPYQNEAVTWWQRITIVTDVGLLWLLWPYFRRGKLTKSYWSDFQNGTFVFMSIGSLAAVLFAFSIATFPGEWLEDTLPPMPFIPGKGAKVDSWRLISLHEILVAGDVDLRTRKPTSLWSNRLVLPGIDVIDHTKFDTEAKIIDTETLSLRARHLEGAVLFGATLRHVDFAAAKLQGALLGNSDLRSANLACAATRLHPKATEMQCTHLEGAALDGAHLEDANLAGAQLPGASLVTAHLQGAALDGANLQGAWLVGANLQGASLDEADLRGASLENADLKGASLDGTQLQGVTLRNAQIQVASFDQVFVWRADARHVTSENTAVAAPNTEQKEACKTSESGSCSFSVESFLSLMRRLAEEIPEGGIRVKVLEQVMQRLDPRKTPEAENEMAGAWNALARSSPGDNVYEKSLAEQWRQTACAVEDAPYSLLGILDQLWGKLPLNDPLSPEEVKLVASLLDQQHCPGTHGLSETKRAELLEIREQNAVAPGLHSRVVRRRHPRHR